MTKKKNCQTAKLLFLSEICKRTYFFFVLSNCNKIVIVLVFTVILHLMRYSILFQLKVQEALRKREKFTKEHEEVSLTSITNVLLLKQTLNTK